MFRSVLDRVKQRLEQHRSPPWEVIAPWDKGKFHQLAARLIFKNEAGYLKEWLDFHRLVGIEKFFLYNNNSEDKYEPVLAPHIADGIVTLHDFPNPLPPPGRWRTTHA
jgi:hypothetical protein